MSLFQFQVKFSKSVYNSLNIEKAERIVRNNNTKVKKISALSNPSKLSCLAWSIPTKYCNCGLVLSNIEGSICKGCYAKRGKYTTPSSIIAMQERYDAWLTQPNWIEAMTLLIKMQSGTLFRWFDSGDLQNIKMILQIMEIARKTKPTKHWLPTHEVSMISNFIKSGYEVPKNMTIRLSSSMINGEPLTSLATELNAYPNVKGYVGTSTVCETELWKKDKNACPAHLQNNKCNTCENCWLHTKNICYEFT